MSTNRIRALLVSMLAVFAVSAVAAGSASAHAYIVCKEAGTEKYTEHECKTKSETGKWSWAEVAGAETFETTSESGPTLFESKLSGVRIIIECKKDEDTGIIEKEGKSKKEIITYKECTIAQVVKHKKEILASCKVGTEGTIKTVALKNTLITGKGIGPEVEFEPESGTTFAEIVITGCSLESTTKVTGKQICQLPEATVGKVKHEVVCSPSGGELKFGAEPASYYGTETVSLSNGWGWAAE
jgi:hypothetical protein